MAWKGGFTREDNLMNPSALLNFTDRWLQAAVVESSPWKHDRERAAVFGSRWDNILALLEAHDNTENGVPHA